MRIRLPAILCVPKTYEALGFTLILLAAGWQVFLSDWYVTEGLRAHFLGVSEQNQYIFMMLQGLRGEAAVSDLRDGFAGASALARGDQEMVGESFFKTVRVLLFLVGSALVVCAKWGEAALAAKDIRIATDRQNSE